MNRGQVKKMDQFDFDYFPVLFSKVKKYIQKRNMELLAPHGLSSLHAMYLMSLFKHPEGMTRNDLNDILGVNKANTSRAVNDLIDKGYATLEDCPRNAKIIISDKGMELAKLIKNNTRSMREKFLGVLTDEEKQVIRNVLRKMLEVNLEGDPDNTKEILK
jgi:DNA-binding MarR family transcriptional regulator